MTIPEPVDPEPVDAEPVADAGDDWRRLHPLSPLLRGGLALIVVAGIVIANLRDRVLEFFLPDEFIGEAGPSESDLVDYIFSRGLAIVLLLVVLGVILLIVLFAWLSWRFRTFRISSEAVEERSGILFRQHRRAPLERIQSVNLQRPLLARALGLTQVDVQTAGQGGQVALRYLGHQQAKQVREQILRAVAVTHDVAAPVPGDAGLLAAGGRPLEPLPTGLPEALDRRARDFVDADVSAEAHRAGNLVRVPVGRLIGSVLLSWDFIVPVAVSVASIIAGIVWMPWMFGLTIPMVIVVVSVCFSQLNRGWGFTLSRSSDGVRVGAGLTATNTETVPFGRIHAVEARQPLAWRPFGWWRVRITTAGHSVAQGGQNRLQNMVLPVGLEADVLRVFETVLPGEADAEVGARLDELSGPGTGFVGAGRRAGWVLWFGRRRAGLRIAGADAPGGSGSADAPGGGGSLAPSTDEATLRIRRGALTRSLGVMPLVRAQSVQLRRPFVHRVLGLASIQAHTVLGPVRVEMRGLDLAAARGVFDRLAEAVVRVQSADAASRARRARAETIVERRAEMPPSATGAHA